MASLRETLGWRIWNHNDVTFYDIMSIELCLDFGNDEHIILCNFGSRIMSDLEVIEERFWSPLPGHRKQKMPSLNRVNNTSSLS